MSKKEIAKEIIASNSFWNDAYGGFNIEEVEFKKRELPVEMKKMFDYFTSSCKTVLDFGCGGADMLTLIGDSSNLVKAYGIESGDNIVRFANYILDKASLKNKIEVLDGGINTLSKFEDESFDGIVISNVLDVVTNDVAENIMKGLYRVLKKNGLLLVKINPSFTEKELLGMGFVNFEDNLYSKNGIMRAREMSTEKWREWFTKVYKMEELDFTTAPWQGPKFFDRLFLLEKR